MPAQMSPSFAAAAGQSGSTRDTRNGGKSDSRGSGDWGRKDSRPAVNGTLTLRRSTNPAGPAAAQSEPSTQNRSESVESQQQNLEHPHHYRYSKQDLLDIYKHQQEAGEVHGGNVSNLYEEGWAPDEFQGSSSRSGWGKNSDGRDYFAPSFCWNISGDTHPICLDEMTDQEKRLFNSDINSHLKPPQSQNSKDSVLNIRKPPASLGQNSNNFSPVSSRPGTRRQQTSDSVGAGLASPNDTSKAFRDDTSLFFGRKFESKEGADERLDDAKSNLNMDGLMRVNPVGSILGSGQASTWGTSSSLAIQPMGTFGNSIFSTSMNSPALSDKRPPTSRTGNRFFQPTSKENLEDISIPKASEKSWRPRQRTDTDPFADEDPCRITVLGGEDNSHHLQRTQGLDTPARERSNDVGMSEIPGFRDAFQREHSHNTPRAVNGHSEPLSPSDTNPYRSPAGPDERQQQNESYDAEVHPSDRGQSLGGIIETSQSAFGNLHRGFPGIPFDGNDRSQTTSTTGSRALPQISGLPSLGVIGSLGGWLTTSGNPSGTPDREIRPGFPSTFGNSIFSSLGESTGLVNVSGGFGSTPVGNGSVNTSSGRGSKLGSLFPAAMQAQMQTTEIDSSVDGDTRQSSAFGAIVRGSFPPPRDNDSPMRTSRHAFDDLFPQIDNPRTTMPISISENSQPPANPPFTTTSQQSFQPQASESVPNQQLPTAQQRMMVMPDRMRWVYLDPQAQVQGPFSGLEMHDWYKASFFTPDLSVKKLEDAEFEPLGQLIRRIGNSREPFLVPQIGIPHGPPSTQPGASFTPPVAGHGHGIVQPGVVQPPFAGSFPSFGTTLTAEQQNNLERRKQEEQYLMARQREFLAQQQVNMKQMQIGGIPSALHHSNVHNLQSQPNFGNISSPLALTPQAAMPAGPGFFDGLSRQIPAGVLPGEFYRDEDVARLSLRDRHGFFNASAAVGPPSQSQQVGALFSQSNIQNQSPRIEDIDFAARLHEFEQLQEQQEIDELGHVQNILQNPNDAVDTSQPFQQIQSYDQPTLAQQKTEGPEVSNSDTLSMTQRVQKATTAKQSKVAPTQLESPWANFNSDLPMPFPPSQSVVPLPAPTAQRGLSRLPEKLDAEELSQSRTPEVTSTTPSVAPWAKEPVEAPKALSLREIQEAEEKKVAKAEELAMATRRANYEQELKLLASQPVAPVPGLPTTATWGNTTSPVNSTPTKSAWAKPVTKTQAPASKQKTLADIQREEELRKQKLAAVAATQSPAGGFGSKRYADLASHTAPNTPPNGGPAWSTVGAGGKVKVPTGPAASTQAPATRSASAHSVTLPIRSNSKPTAAARSATTPAINNIGIARDEFTKWAKATLDKGLNPGINVNDFVVMLSSFPSESSIIADSIYSHSQTMNGNDFAMEFIRRRNNAEKGIIEPVNSGSGTSLSHSSDRSGGWSEVAKKGPPKEEQTAGFKVVPSKKKGKK